MKKLLSVILACIMVLSLAACGGPKGEKLNMTIKANGMEEGSVYSADVYYKPSESIEVSSSYENRQEIIDEAENIMISFRLCSDSTYTNNKELSKEDEVDYKEIKIGDFDGYAYSYSTNTHMAYVRFEGVDESGEQNRYMEIKVCPADRNMDIVGSELFESKYVQNILKTLTYNGLITPGAEAEE